MEKDDSFYFWLCWMGLGLGSFLFFHFNRNAGLKRLIFPLFLIFANAIFLYVVWLIMKSPGILVAAAAVTIVINFINFRKTRFCNNCGRTVYGGDLIARPKECPHCENALD